MFINRFADEKSGSAFAVYFAYDKKAEMLLDELNNDGYDIIVSAVSDCDERDALRCADRMYDTLDNSAALVIFEPRYDGAPSGFEILASLLTEHATEMDIPVTLVEQEAPDGSPERSAMRKLRDALRLCRAPRPRPQRPDRPAVPDDEPTGVPESET